MPSVGVVPAFNESEDLPASNRVRIEAGAIDELTFERCKEALTHRVVVAVADRTHRWSDAFVEAAFPESDRRVLASLVGVMDNVGWTTLVQGHVER